MSIGVELLTFSLGVYATLAGVSWEASHMAGRRARFEFAHHGAIRTSQIFAYHS